MEGNKDIYFRYDFNNYDPTFPFLTEFLKVRETPKGFVVIRKCMESYYFHKKRSGDTKENREYKRSLERFVLNDSIKKHCYKTKKDALHGFIKRQESRLRIIKNQVKSLSELVEFCSNEDHLLMILNESREKEADELMAKDVEGIRGLFKI